MHRNRTIASLAGLAIAIAIAVVIFRSRETSNRELPATLANNEKYRDEVIQRLVDSSLGIFDSHVDPAVGRVISASLHERVVRWLYMTPRLHAAHHTVTLRSRDANYSTIFLGWDRLHGTLEEADYGELERLGLEVGRDTDLSFLELMRCPFITPR